MSNWKELEDKWTLRTPEQLKESDEVEYWAAWHETVAPKLKEGAGNPSSLEYFQENFWKIKQPDETIVSPTIWPEKPGIGLYAQMMNPNVQTYSKSALTPELVKEYLMDLFYKRKRPE